MGCTCGLGFKWAEMGLLLQGLTSDGLGQNSLGSAGLFWADVAGLHALLLGSSKMLRGLARLVG